MGWFTKKIEVTLIDDATGEPFGVTRMPPDDLPESFELDTTLHLGNEDWSVVDAQPTTRAEYAKSKRLTLRLRRNEKIDPSKILYSLPSVCDVIPAVSGNPLSGDVTLQPSEADVGGNGGNCLVRRNCSRAATTVRMGS